MAVQQSDSDKHGRIEDNPWAIYKKEETSTKMMSDTSYIALTPQSQQKCACCKSK